MFKATERSYKIPISDEQKNELAGRGVPAIFITDLNSKGN